jgi:hypothetical protein
MFWNGTNDGEYSPRASVVAGEEVLGCCYQSLYVLEQLTMGDLTPKVAPQHLNGVEPGTIGRQVQQYQPSCRGPYHCFHFIVCMGAGIVPGHVDRLGGVLIQQGLQQLGYLPPALPASEEHHRLPGMVIDGPDTIVFSGLSWCGDHDLLAFGTPHGPQGGQPTEVEFIGVIKDFFCLQAISGFLNRLFLTRYTGSGLLILCWGRLSTMSASSR